MATIKFISVGTLKEDYLREAVKEYSKRLSGFCNVVEVNIKEAKLPKSTACIRCGACTNTCPFGLAPANILRAYKRGDAEALKRLSVDTCMLCGCCSFVCPANRPLVQTNSLAKQFLREEKAKEDSKNG